MSALTDLQAQLQSQLAALSAREKRMLGGASAAVGIFIVFTVFFSFNNTANQIRDRTSKKIVQLEEVQTLASGYREAKAKQDMLENQLRVSNVRLVSYLEDKAKPAGIELPSINPKADIPLEGSKIIESSVEVTLTDVKINRLIDFMTSVEAGPGIVKIKYMRLEPRPAQETVTAWLTIATYKLK
jgi:general secretion pathway protein M